MKNTYSPILILFLLSCSTLFSQPYHIDKSKPAPKALVLFEDPENEGVKLASYEGELTSEAQRFFMEEYSEYQPVDIFLFSRTEGSALEMNLVLATWNDKKESCSTGSEGYCQLQFRIYGGVGLDINGEQGTEYTILVVAGKEVKPELKSPFYKVSQRELESGEIEKSSGTQVEPSRNTQTEGSGNLVLYAIAVLLLLIVILLGVIVFRKNKSALILLLVSGLSLAYGQETEQELRDRLAEEIKQEVKAEFKRFQDAQKKLKNVEGVLEQIEKLRKAQASYEAFSTAYSGLGDCISGAAPTNSPRIPSFCASDGSRESIVESAECSDCFLDARSKFNDVRFTLARLETIYTCTKNMTTSAKAFGDSFSSATKSGLGWASARRKIEESEKSMAKAYDDKYVDLMGDLQGALVEMSICEAKFGLVDWYDRFGFVYYEFMVDRYKRKN
ncbi:MAG: hypothetical protein AAGA10_20295 [Bacteroidota bacterium]